MQWFLQPPNGKMSNDIIVIFFYVIPVIMVAATIWAFDLQELLSKAKRADRIKAIQEDARWIAKKIHNTLMRLPEFLKKAAPYMLRFLKSLLHLTGCLFRLAVWLVQWLIRNLKRFFQETEDRQFQIPQELLLTIEENDKLANALEGKPYESIFFENIDCRRPFAVWYEASAAGLVHQYQETEPEERNRIIELRIKKFMAEKRKVQAYIRIIAATPTKLYFAVTYSPYGWNRLLQIYPPIEDAGQQTPPPALEEAIPEKDGAGEKDSGGEDDWL